MIAEIVLHADVFDVAGKILVLLVLALFVLVAGSFLVLGWLEETSIGKALCNWWRDL